MNEQYTERYWRDATPEDAIKEPPMVARFRIDEKDVWSVDTLQGLDRSASFRWIGQDVKGKECQVYDAPDPGEGWRLIDVKKEKPQGGDEYFAPYSKAWCLCPGFLLSLGYSEDSIVRRRIEPPKPKPKYVPFEWEDREELKSRWIRYSSKGQTVVEVCVKFTNDEDGFLINDTYNYWLLDNATFLDTGEPVGRKVQ